MASALISSILKAATDWLSLIRSTPTTSSTSSAVADDLEKLKRMLQRIKTVLQDAEEREILDKSVMLWLKEIKEVAYDAEDVLAEYQYHVVRAQVEIQAIEEAAAAEAAASRKGKYVEGEEEVIVPLTSASNMVASKVSILNSMAGRIKSVRKRFKEISNDRDRLHLKSEDGQRRRGSSSEYEYPQPTSHMINEQEIYGREDDRKKVMDWLFSNKESKFEVLAVVGKGGLGKTTLAQLIYNNPKTSDYFEHKMWICVSNDFDLVRLTRAMIESITKGSCTLSEFSLLQESLQKRLQGKRVLMVLDDVWNESKDLWESLSIPFHDAEMVRIIVTTRNFSVAEIMQTTAPYGLGYLPEEQCWQLFRHRAFGDRDPCQFPGLVDIGRKIVKKCNGLPLSVKSLGGLLQHEPDEGRWNEVLESEVWELDEKTGILPALKLSYIRMPNHLKHCFVICSMFPKDHIFRIDTLVQLWAAQGYIQHKKVEKDVEETGYKYVDELHRRSFFDEWDVFGMAKEKGNKYYKMHDNVHDLAKYIQVETELINDMEHKIRHLYATYKSSKLALQDLGALKTLILNQNTIPIADMLQGNMCKLTRLRYLDISLSRDYLVPEEIGDLKCLRHLNLYTPAKGSLPKSIGHLYNLVLLEIRCSGLAELPETLTNLVSLTSIQLRGFRNDRLPALGQLPSLRSLTLSEFSNVTRIGNEFCTSANSPRRAAFPSLTSLVLKHMRAWEEWDGLQEGDFPKLQKLEIYNCPSLWLLPSLQIIHSLSHVKIEDCPSLWRSMERSNLIPFDRSRGKMKLCSLGKLKKLEKLTGTFGMRIDEVVVVLKKVVSLTHLTLSQLRNVPSALNSQFCLREHSGIEKLVLDWSIPDVKEHPKKLVLDWSIPDWLNEKLHLRVRRGHDHSTTDDYDNASFSLLDNLQPHANLMGLEIVGYHGHLCPSWIGDPSYDKLTEVALKASSIDQLPALGQLPSLKNLTLDSISRLKIISYEFSHGMNLNDVPFPSLVSLKFQNMPDWDKWYGVRKGDFPELRVITVQDCPALTSLPLQNLHSLVDLSMEGCTALPVSGLNTVLMLSASIDGSPFNKLTKLSIRCCNTERLPAFGQLPSLSLLTLESVSGLKIIGDEFCRGKYSHQEVAFPSLTKLDFKYMPDWVEWGAPRGVGDFPQIEYLRVEKCPKLCSLPPLSSLPPNIQLNIIDCPALYHNPEFKVAANKLEGTS